LHDSYLNWVGTEPGVFHLTLLIVGYKTGFVITNVIDK